MIELKSTQSRDERKLYQLKYFSQVVSCLQWIHARPSPIIVAENLNLIESVFPITIALEIELMCSYCGDETQITREEQSSVVVYWFWFAVSAVASLDSISIGIDHRESGWHWIYSESESPQKVSNREKAHRICLRCLAIGTTFWCRRWATHRRSCCVLAETYVCVRVRINLSFNLFKPNAKRLSGFVIASLVNRIQIARMRFKFIIINI